MAFNTPLSFGVVGFSARYFGSGNIDVYDDDFVQSNTSASDFLASGSYALHFADFSFGFTGKLIQSRLGDFVGRTAALDMGMIYYFDVPSIFKQGKNLNLGIGGMVKNISPGIKYGEITTALPWAYAGGIYYNITNFSYLETNLELFVHRFHETEIAYGGAVEFTIMRYFQLRGGISQITTDGSNETEIAPAGGASVFVDFHNTRYEIAYSAEPSSTFGLQHHFGLRVQFGGGAKYPFGLRAGPQKVKKVGAPEYEYGDINDDDRVILQYLRNSIYKFKVQNGRFPTDLNELLLFLNKYHVYEIPNPKRGTYRYNKRTGKLFIREI